ncbi:GTPase Obg [Bienertia sinuspersici]
MEDVGSTKMEQVSVDNEEKEIADDKNQLKAESSEGIDSYNDLPVANCDIIISRTLQLQRNKYLAELSDQERILADFLFYSEYQDVSILSVDENNPAVIQQNEELRHTLECSVLLDIVNPANPDMHRKKKEKIESIIAEKDIDLEKAKDNPCYDTMKAEWLKDKQKMTYRESAFFADKCRQSMSEWEKIVMFCKVFCKVIESSVVVLMVFTIGIEGLFLLLGEVIKMTLIVVFIALKLWNGMTAYTKNLSRCHLAIDLVSYKENRRKQEVLEECALWSAKKPFLIQQQKK